MAEPAANPVVVVLDDTAADDNPVAAAAAGEFGSGANGPAAEVAGTSHPARPPIRWDQFLPRRSLRVLLVEHDESTRQVVAALLRKCNYRVAAVADGMKAWEVMQARDYCFDLVLTEVVTPTLSGIGLLSLIVAAEECKNIPVIMMSSQDSIGVVLKCMLKGAVDFLVKPVRKNELRNLWQHVWRRHCSIGQSNGLSETNAASNHLSANGEGSMSGENSDAQGSGKGEVEIQSAETFRETVVPQEAGISKEMEKRPKEVDGGKDINLILFHDAKEFRVLPDQVKTPLQFPSKVMLELACANSAKPTVENPESCSNTNKDSTSPCHRNTLVNDLSNINYGMSDGTCTHIMESRAYVGNMECEASTYFAGEGSKCDFSQSLKVTLQKQQLNGYTDQEPKERDMFTHSSFSAFSRYGDKQLQLSVQNTYTCTLNWQVVNGRDCSLQADKTVNPTQNNASEPTCNQVSSDCNNEASRTKFPCTDVEGTSPNSTMSYTPYHHPQFSFVPLSIPVGAIPYPNFCSGNGAVMQHLYYPQASFLPHNLSAFEMATSQNGYHQPNSLSVPVAHPHYSDEMDRNHQFCHTKEIQGEPAEHRDLNSVLVDEGNQSCSCNQDIWKCSGCSGSGETADGTTNTFMGLESGNESGIRNCHIKDPDNDKSRREAALIKFRMKRKDRCFEKKVRYHSRKKLAEQRPRVKGQFVSQKTSKSAASTEKEDCDP